MTTPNYTDGSGVTYRPYPGWQDELAQYGAVQIHALAPRTDMYGPGTNTHQHKSLWLRKDGTVYFDGHKQIDVGRIDPV